MIKTLPLKRGHLAVAIATMSRRESPSKISTAASLTPPPAKYTPMTDTPMLEAPTSTTQLQTAVTADRIKQEQEQQQEQEQPQLQHPAPEHAPLMTDLPPTSTFPREHPPREPTSIQPTPRLYDNITPDRKPLHLSVYPTAPNSLSQTPHLVMPAPSALRAHAGTPTTDRVAQVSSYPTAPGSAAQTPQPSKSRTSQHGMSSAGWLVPPAANSASKITFEGMSSTSLSPFPSILSFLFFSFLPSSKDKGKKKENKRILASNKRCNTDYLSLSEITFEWGDSYDDKDWMRLRAILAPTLMVCPSPLCCLSRPSHPKFPLPRAHKKKGETFN